MRQHTAKQLMVGTIIAALIYSTLMWAIIIPAWLSGGAWKVAGVLVFILWAFFFIGFTIRHIIGYARTARNQSFQDADSSHHK